MNKIIDKYQALINKSNAKKKEELDNIKAQLIKNEKELSEISKIIDDGIPNTEEYIDKLHQKEDLLKTNEMLKSYSAKIKNQKSISEDEFQFCIEEIEGEQFRIFNELSNKYKRFIIEFISDVDKAYSDIEELTKTLLGVNTNLMKDIVPKAKTKFNEYDLVYIKNNILNSNWYKSLLETEEDSESNE